MHLSPLFGATLSDLHADRPDKAERDAFARQHRDGLLRGLVFASALLMPFALTFVLAAFNHSHLLPASFEVRP